MTIQTFLLHHIALPITAGLTIVIATVPAEAGQIFNLTATNISFDIPSPLFTDSHISGFLVVSDSVVPGGSFGAGQLQQFSFNIAGYKFTQANLDPSFSSIDVDGRISADGQTIPFLQIGYSLNPAFPGCSFVCAGSFNIAQSAQSNFVVADDPNADTLGLVQFDAAFQKVPEPATISLLAVGGLGMAALRRRRKRSDAGETA